MQGLSGRWVAGRLGVLLPSERGYVIAGANALGRLLAKELKKAGEDVVLIDANPQEVAAAVEEGLTAREGDAFDEDILLAADIEGRRGFIAVTPNEGANLLLAQLTKRKYRLSSTYIALSASGAAVSPQRTQDAGIRVLFGAPIHINSWISVLERVPPRIERWTFDQAQEGVLPLSPNPWQPQDQRALLPLLVMRNGASVGIAMDRATLHKGDQVLFAGAGDLPESAVAPGKDQQWVQTAQLPAAARPGSSAA